MRRLSAGAFDTLIVCLTGVLVLGGYTLVWADNNGLITGNQLFSVWSVPLYAGFLIAAYLLFVWWGPRRGASSSRISAYRYSVLGAALFLVGLLIEFVLRATGGRPPSGPEGVLVPSRVLLFAATLLILTGPILSIVERRGAAGEPDEGNATKGSGWRNGIPTLALALGLALAVLTLLTETIHPIVVLAGASDPTGSQTQTPTDLYLVPVDASGSRRLTTSPDLWEVHPDVSPDGTTIAYGAGPLGDLRIYTLALAGGQAARVTAGDQNEDGPIWSPDGKVLSYWSPLAVQQAPTETPVRPGPAPAPSANVRSEPVSRSGLAVWFVPVGRPQSAHAWNEIGGEGIEAWSPSGDQYCGWALENGSFDVVTWDATTGARVPVTSGSGDAWGCTWSPDGQRLAWHSDEGGNFNIYTGAADGSDIRQLTTDTEVNQLPRWSPDGTRIAWISTSSGDFDIWVANADGSAARNVTNDPALDDGFYGISWLPDGSGIIAASAGRIVPTQISSESVPLGVGSIALEVILLVGTLLLTLRLAPDVAGIATAVSAVDALLLILVTSEPLLCLAVVAAGVAADVAAGLLRARSSTFSARTWTGVVSAVVFVAVYFVLLELVRGLGWDPELVIGIVLLAGLLGFVASVAIQPLVPELEEVE